MFAPPSPYSIRQLDLAEIDEWRAYLRRSMEDNGRDGVWFAPMTAEDTIARFTPEKAAEARVAHARPLTEPGWRRAFLVRDAAGVIVGSADLNGGAILGEIHRCRLGIGLAWGHHGKGLGEALLRGTLRWAKDEGLAWVDLGVFVGNARAERLYRRVGFVEVARVRDRFRVGDVVLDDVAMVLDLAGWSAG